MSTPSSRYKLAQERARRAAEACVHWDYETRGEPGEHDCCREYADALRERTLAREAYLREVQS